MVRFMRSWLILIIIVCHLMILGCTQPELSVDLNDYYPPKILAESIYYSVTIPVEIHIKDGKKSFTQLFELYGFSGNGPSIEQVIRRNTALTGVTYDSEGDAFHIYATDAMTQKVAIEQLKCIQDIICLNEWLKKSRTILFKE